MRIRPGCGRTCAALLLGWACHASGAEADGSWTNVAGQVLRATPQAIRGQTVTFAFAGTGRTGEYPLSVFPPPEQERLRTCLKDTTIPEGLQSACEYARRILARTRLLRENGQMSEEDFRKSSATTLAALRQQAAPLVEQQILSRERLELILDELAAPPE
mgnify:CR=1 FL=1